MNGFNERKEQGQFEETLDKKQLLSSLMSDLAIAEEMLFQYDNQLVKFKSDKDCEEYLNAENWVAFYKQEILRLSKEIDELHQQLFGVETPKLPEQPQDPEEMLSIVRSTHPDISEILKSIGPQD